MLMVIVFMRLKCEICLVPIAVLVEDCKKDFSEVRVIVVDHIRPKEPVNNDDDYDDDNDVNDDNDGNDDNDDNDNGDNDDNDKTYLSPLRDDSLPQ